jgi:VanZ family protein
MSEPKLRPTKPLVFSEVCADEEFRAKVTQRHRGRSEEARKTRRCSSRSQHQLENSELAEQPWRNPRPAPQLSEMRPRLRELFVVRWLVAWWPALAWAAVIFGMSTDAFSSEHTGSMIEPILRWLFPACNAEQIGLLHHMIRKSAHFTEYFIFALLLFRGIKLGRPGWRWSWGLLALFVAAFYSALDEIHQSFVASRTASPYDSLLDTTGAFAAIVLVFLWFRWQETKTITAAASSLDPAS